MDVLKFLNRIIVLSFLTIIPLFSQGYEISITVNARSDTVYLCHYFAKSEVYRADNMIVMEKGKGVFRGDQELAHGNYFLIGNGRRLLFDFLIGDNQHFGIVADTTDFLNLTKFTNSPDNDIFFEFQRYMVNRGKDFYKLNEEFQNASSDDEKNDIRAKIQAMQKERIEYIEKQVAENSNMLRNPKRLDGVSTDEIEGLYVAKFLRTLLPLDNYLPEPPKDEEGNIADPDFLRLWYRDNFFANFDIFDPQMLRTKHYEEKLLEYFTTPWLIPQHQDSICVEIDKILTKAKANDEVFRCILASLVNHYAKSQLIIHINVQVHLAEKWYIPYATWSTEEQIENMKKFVETNKLRIGDIAPPIEALMILPPEHFKAAALDTAIKFDIHAGIQIQDFRKDLPKKKYTVLFFWDYSCGHCKKAIQELFEAYEELKNDDLQIITIQTVGSREAKGKWIDLINERNYFGWINAWAPYTHDANGNFLGKWREFYIPIATPKMYLLDENSTIVLKEIVPTQLTDIIPKNNE